MAIRLEKGRLIMADGTVLNNVFIPRLHRSNARDVLDECESSLAHAKSKILMLVASSPTADIDTLLSEVGELMDWYDDSFFRAWAARYVLEDPNNCVDDYDEVEK